MGRNGKYTIEFKKEIVKKYLNGEGSSLVLGKEFGINDTLIRRWTKKYTTFGETAFDKHQINSSYTKEFKTQVVIDYLNGVGSYDELTNKYNIPSHETIRKWVKDYNSHIGLKDYLPGGKEIYMTKSRKVTVEERIEIAKYCLAHDCDYKTTAKVFETTYANVFNWVKKFKEHGEEGLEDKRGHHRSDEEVDEITLLKRQLKQKEHELEMAQLEVKLLKKLDEIERRRFTERVNMKRNMKQLKK